MGRRKRIKEEEYRGESNSSEDFRVRRCDDRTLTRFVLSVLDRQFRGGMSVSFVFLLLIADN